MRRLTLILSDLYLPEESAPGGLPAAVDLPSLDALLRFASRRQKLPDWRRWLAHEFGTSGLAKLPVAQACALEVLSAPELGGAWLATHWGPAPAPAKPAPRTRAARQRA